MAPGGRRGLRSRLDWIDREKKRVKYWGEFVRKMKSILVHTDSENTSMVVGYKFASMVQYYGSSLLVTWKFIIGYCQVLIY